jgi:hypothetical protein
MVWLRHSLDLIQHPQAVVVFRVVSSEGFGSLVFFGLRIRAVLGYDLPVFLNSFE